MDSHAQFLVLLTRQERRGGKKKKKNARRNREGSSYIYVNLNYQGKNAVRRGKEKGKKRKARER